MKYFIYEITSDGEMTDIEGHVREDKALERWEFRRASAPRACIAYVEKEKIGAPERRSKLARAAGRNKNSTKS